MSELRRILRTGGWALVLVPLDRARAATLEDPAITTPGQREAAYLQSDYVRLYAPDIAVRLRDAGFQVTAVSLAGELPPTVARRHGLSAADVIFRCEADGPPGTRTQI